MTLSRGAARACHLLRRRGRVCSLFAWRFEGTSLRRLLRLFFGGGEVGDDEVGTLRIRSDDGADE
jgi:hypothetical protein